MKRDGRSARSLHLCRLAVPLVAAGMLSACHHSEAWEPMATQKIYLSDRFYDLALLGPKEALIAGYNGKLLSSKDGGASWALVDTGTRNALYSIDFASNNKTGWMVGQAAEILKTTDGGKTWVEQGGHVYLSDDCRQSGGDPDATEESNKCPLAPLFAVSVIDENSAVAIGDRSTLARTTDGGKTWKTTTLKSPMAAGQDENSMIAFEDPVLYDVLFLDAKTGFVVGEFGKIFKTTDGGDTWTEKEGTLVGGDYFDIQELPTFFDIDFHGTSEGIAVGLDGRIARSKDGGETWQWTPNNVEAYDAPFYSADILPNGSVWVVGASGQVVSAAAGAELGQGTFGTQVTNWIRDIEFYDDQNGWAIGGFGFIMTTSDGGKTWFRRIG